MVQDPLHIGDRKQRLTIQMLDFVAGAKAGLFGERASVHSEHGRPAARIENQADRLGMRIRKEHLLGNRTSFVAVELPLGITDLMAMNAALNDVAFIVELTAVFALEGRIILWRSEIRGEPAFGRESVLLPRINR